MPEKQAYIQKHEAQMEQWEAKLDEMKAKAAEASADFKIEYQKQIENVQTKMSAQRKKLREISQAGEDAWEELNNGFDAAWKDLEATWGRVVATLSVYVTQNTRNESNRDVSRGVRETASLAQAAQEGKQ